MALSLIAYLNSGFFSGFIDPPPAAAFVHKIIESADPVDMQVRATRAVAEVVAQNAAIVAAFPNDSDLLLSIADADLAGGGDGHTFILEMTWVPIAANTLIVLLPDLDPSTLFPENVGFQCCLASENEALANVFGPMVDRATLDVPFGVFPEVLTFMQAVRGSSKGTRFMACLGYLRPIPQGNGPSIAAPVRPGGGAPRNLLGMLGQKKPT
jgi:hypothetical protein